MAAQIISSLAQMIAVFIDGVITGKVLGEQAMAAYGYCSPVVSLVVAFSGFILTGFSALLGRTVGGADKERLTGVFSTGMAITNAVGIVLTIAVVCFSHTLPLRPSTCVSILMLIWMENGRLVIGYSDANLNRYIIIQLN
jgi:Na+-driven multidrug efflux pump